jgi:hypothetical protein
MVVYWMILAPLTMALQVVLAALNSSVELPLGVVVGGALTATTAYMGKRAVQEAKK